MTETTTNVFAAIAAAADSGDPQLLAAAMKALENQNPAVLAARKQLEEQQKVAAKAEREREQRENQARFDSIREEFELFLAAAQDAGYPVETWHKRKDGKQTDQVSGVGYHVHGKRAIRVNGRLREANVTVFVKWNPNGGSLPVDDEPQG